MLQKHKITLFQQLMLKGVYKQVSPEEAQDSWETRDRGKLCRRSSTTTTTTKFEDSLQHGQPDVGSDNYHQDSTERILG